MVRQSPLIIPKVAAHCTGDACILPGEHLCTKCGGMVCEMVGGIIGDVAHSTMVKRFDDGHAIYCMYCRMIAKPHVFCAPCAQSHELELNLRGSCRLAYRALHESGYDVGFDESTDRTMVEGRSSENATELGGMRQDKYKKMDSTTPDGAKLIRSQEDQDFELDVEETLDDDGQLVTTQVDSTKPKAD